MKKIVALFPGLRLGGAERQLYELCVALSKKDDVEMVVYDLSGERNISYVDENGILVKGFGLDVICSGIGNAYLRRLAREFVLFRLFWVIILDKPKLVVAYNPVFIYTLLFSRLAKIKVAYSIRESDPKFLSSLRMFFARKFNFLSTNTPSVYERFKYKNEEFKLILNKIESNVAISEGGAGYALVVSNVEWHKRVHIAIEAAGRVDIPLVVCGSVANKDYYDFCMKVAIENNASVTFLGKIGSDELDLKYREADLLIHPSSMEGTSNAVIDGVLRLVPLLVSDIDENMYLVGGRDMFSFECDNVDSLCDSINRLRHGLNEKVIRRQLEQVKIEMVQNFESSGCDAYAEYLVSEL